MVSPYLETVAEEIGPPFCEGVDDGQLFFFMNRVIEFGPFERARIICDRAGCLISGPKGENRARAEIRALFLAFSSSKYSIMGRNHSVRTRTL